VRPSGELTWQEMDRLHRRASLAFPAETEGQGVIMEPVMDGDVKVFELTASEFEWEVEPGVWRHAMGYNGMVPGPQIRVQLGDPSASSSTTSSASRRRSTSTASCCRTTRTACPSSPSRR
jgi:hypothetical protein